MNLKIERIREDILRTESKIRECNEYLKTLKIREKQLCNEEVVKTMRGLVGKDGDVMELLARLKASVEADEVRQEILSKVDAVEQDENDVDYVLGESAGEEMDTDEI